MLKFNSTESAAYPSKEYHEEKDRIFSAVESKFMYVQEELNSYVELIGCVGIDENTGRFRDPTPAEFVDNMVQFHNRCVENIQKGQSVPRYTALLTECRARMKGALASDDVLKEVKGLQAP